MRTAAFDEKKILFVLEMMGSSRTIVLFLPKIKQKCYCEIFHFYLTKGLYISENKKGITKKLMSSYHFLYSL